jgi:hypothetical protein
MSSNWVADFVFLKEEDQELLLSLANLVISKAKDLGVGENGAREAIRIALAEAPKASAPIAEVVAEDAAKPAEDAAKPAEKPDKDAKPVVLKPQTAATLNNKSREALALYVSEAFKSDDNGGTPRITLEDLLAKNGKANAFTKDQMIQYLKKFRPELVK